jgi:hypothetical protein
MRELARHFAIFAGIFVLALLLGIAGYIWLAPTETECVSDGGTWDARVEICHRN